MKNNHQKINTRETGSQYEKMAEQFLEKHGYRILEHNYRCRFSEIDLIAMDQDTLVFCEVRYRSGSLSNSLESVDVRKQRRISRAALFYISEKKLALETPCRFDVIGINGQIIRLIKNAFDYTE